MAQSVIFLVVGLFLLVMGADYLVIGASRLAKARNISPIVVGALLIGFGTSLPEMLVSSLAAARGDSDLGVGNVIGSNVANLSLVLGVSLPVAALFMKVRRIEVPIRTLYWEGLLAVGSAGLFWLLIQDGLERWEGVVLVVAFVAAMTAILKRPADKAEVKTEVSAPKAPAAPINQRLELVRAIGGLVATGVGVQMAVSGALDIAEEANLGTGFVGLSLVAVGTSLPELITGVHAIRRGEAGLLVGNILGSNIFNSLAVGALIAFIGPGPLVDNNLAGLAMWIMVGVSVGAWLLMFNGKGFSSKGLLHWWEGAILLVVYLVSLPFLVSDHSDDSTSVGSPEVTASVVAEPYDPF